MNRSADARDVQEGSRPCENAAPHSETALDHQRGDFRVFLLFCVSIQIPCTSVQRGAAVGVAIKSTARASRPDGCQQWLDADDVQHTREIVAEYVQRHFGRDIGQPLHLAEMRKRSLATAG
jgi:hypothetical protein